MEAPSDFLRESFNHTLILSPDIFIAEPGEQVLLVQLIQLSGLLRNLREQVRDFILHVHPARRQQIHLNDHVPIFFEAARLGDQSPAFLRLRGRVEAIGGAQETWLLGGVVREGLAVGYVAGCGRIQLVFCKQRVGVAVGGEYRLVRSRHIVSEGDGGYAREVY